MRVEELMSSATGCRADDSVRDCARVMRDESIGFMPICDDHERPIGAITDRDLAVRVLADGRSPDEKVQSFMSRGVISCRLGADVQDAERLMREKRKSRIMVCDDDGKLKGVISLADIADIESEQSAGATLQQVKSDQPSATH
ncbi:CBS domain-containing protein [Anaeromyxobacter oryzae]|uniref:Inosine-5-monophosphate dehydrogenase n=1 Tax=Anaeromyxobacter oryzae TaxID=2918170 RepID=A0ABN6MU45_9BACT|nr:CBS domain-containing protein [Anaeromyxobacter oryzae]BDG03165.1 inosine-5-monophosphate dehydrogenase [Anaeromyxobacter oryzae]